MNKQESARLFIENLGIHNLPAKDILAKYNAMENSLSEEYAKGITYDDVKNALTRFVKGDCTYLARKPKSNPLKRGTIMEFVSCVASEGKRFSPEERQFAINALSMEWQG